MDQQSDLVAIGTSGVLHHAGGLGLHLQDRELHQDHLLGLDQVSLYAAGEDGIVSLFSISKQCLVDTIKHTKNPVYYLALNKDGSIQAMGSRNIHILDVSSKKVTKTVTGHANPVTRMEIVGNILYSCSQSERVVSMWSLEGKETRSVKTPGVNDEMTDLTTHMTADSIVTLVVQW